jgi:hypothetical protein
MPEMKMNQNRQWLLRMADEEANCEVSAIGLAHEAGLLSDTGPEKDLEDLEDAIKNNAGQPLIPWEQAKKDLDLEG